jgi:hypothetical protein
MTTKQECHPEHPELVEGRRATTKQECHPEHPELVEGRSGTTKLMSHFDRLNVTVFLCDNLFLYIKKMSC